MRVGFIGTGNMAEALIAGLVAQKKIGPARLVGYDLQSARLHFIKKKYKIRKARSLKEITQKTQIIVLAVKPQHMENLLHELKPHLKKHLLLSIAAGLDTKWFMHRLAKNQRLIRIMPNTPALVGRGVAVFCMNKNCLRRDRIIANTIFKAVGDVFEVKNETWLDAITGLSGSGPAFVYAFIAALTQGGIKSGLKAALAGELATKTVLGAATLLQQSGESPDQLIKKVASKGGTTEAGLKVLKQKGFKNSVIKCIQQATQRAQQLRRN